VALRKEGTVWTWGNNRDGQLGDGTDSIQKSTPVQVLGVSNVVAVAAGVYHTVVIKGDDTVWTWGSDTSGQLGYGTSGGHTSRPQEVRFPDTCTFAIRPSVTTNTLSYIGITTAVLSGVVTSGGCAFVFDRGFCVSTSPTPTAPSVRPLNITGTGSFDSVLTGLNPNTTYYVRAYAMNYQGIAYGNEVTFKTSSSATIGDVNGDGKVDLADAILALQVIAGLNPAGVKVSADVNNDGKIGLEEVIYILQKAAGLR